MNFDLNDFVVVKSGDYPKAKETFQKNKKSSTICVALLNGKDDFVRVR